ncbi:hypothetical protein M9H77_01028 [Catharanthus roseus]|uniref:Uncharacterized protein n=1 Tax=Catharanthus roseus TaxID=4058 RepID=A0ACC0C4D6_CATRO|nr:hypothetical protein M9H77_01028 [Catharanthus roseus]
MEYYWKLTRFKFIKTRLLIMVYLVLLLIFSVSAIFISPPPVPVLNPQYPLEPNRCPFAAECHFYYLQNLKNRLVQKNAAMVDNYGVVAARKLLGGPGSSPPRCISKCGRCTPCRPVHVPVPPGTPVTAEYYPEAWRCKCGNKLYMP